MPEWLIEEGIGEQRLALVDEDEIVEARILVDGIVPAGSIMAARLANAGKNDRWSIATVDGQEYLLPAKPPVGVTEGAFVDIEITREVIPGGEAWKRPRARIVKWGYQGIPTLPTARKLVFPGAPNQLDEAGWAELVDEARTGTVGFAGGELRISPTPAMTLIDVDGQLPPEDLAVAGVAAAVRTILRHGIGGSIGIDLPTIEGKQLRTAIGRIIDDRLSKPFERTAVNGFGFLQIVRPRRHASLFELAADRATFEARALLRQVAREQGALRLVSHPALVGVLQRNPKWVERLAGQVGGPVSLRADATLPISGGYAERP